MARPYGLEWFSQGTVLEKLFSDIGSPFEMHEVYRVTIQQVGLDGKGFDRD